MKMTLAAQLYQIIVEMVTNTTNMSYRKLFNNTSRSSKKYLNIAMKAQKMCIKYTNRECCLHVRSVSGAATRGEQRDSSQLASSPRTEIVTATTGVCSDALMCLAAGEFATVRSPIWMQFLPSSAKIQISLHVVYYEACIASLSSAEFMVSDSLAGAVLLKTQQQSSSNH